MRLKFCEKLQLAFVVIMMMNVVLLSLITLLLYIGNTVEA